MISAVQTLFGSTVQGDDVIRTVLVNSHGTEIALLNYGATIQSIRTKDADGNLANIVLSCDTIEDYQKQGVYIGAVVGRCANRIAGGHLPLDGQDYQLTCNNHGNHLHSGATGAHQKVWSQRISEESDAVSVTMVCHSLDGDDGYPGHVEMQVTYTLTESDIFDIRYCAKTNKTTVVSMTQHSYFNLAGAGNCLNHRIQLDAEAWLPLNHNSIPLGEVRSVDGTVFDFRTPKNIGQSMADSKGGAEQLTMCRGYDHNFCLHQEQSGTLRRFGEVWEPVSGRVVTFYTDQPGVQLYTGNYLEGTPAPNGQVYQNYAGFCLETQGWPDAPNQPTFPSMTLRSGETYHHHTRWHFGCRSE